MKLHRIRAVFMRGGTSKALVFRAGDLPADRAAWDAIFLAAMGVPDPNGRNLDGMAGGMSSLNKVCVVGPATHPEADVDYTFVQLGVDEPLADYGGNCGNMSSAIGPFAVEEGLVPCPATGEAVVRIHNTNTGKLIVARFAVADGALAADGDMALDGVSGTAAAVKLEFVSPGGARTGRLLPTGNAVDVLEVAGVGRIEASLVDAANPCVFVDAATLGMRGVEMPADLDKDAGFLQRMEAIRRAGSLAMGLAGDLDAAGRLASIPKVAMLCAPQPATTISGRVLAADESDLIVRMISIGQPHRAVPITGSICLAVAARLPGTIAHRLCADREGPIRIGHASGTTVVDADVQNGEARYGAVYRTARRLFEGNVIYRL
ncbi:MAG: PrpF protein [Sphingomonadales bacterium]|nr:PrpF protein [Sphingomonadales bacterium]